MAAWGKKHERRMATAAATRTPAVPAAWGAAGASVRGRGIGAGGGVRIRFAGVAGSCERRGRCGVRTLARPARLEAHRVAARSEEHTSELHSLMRISYAVF